METKISAPAFVPNSHERYKGSCEFGLSGQRHVENVSDVDEMQALKAEDVLNVRRRIAKRSISPQMNIFRHAADRPRDTIKEQLLKNQNRQFKT